MNPPDTIPEAGIDIIRKHLCLEIDFERWPHAYQSLATVIDTLQKQCEELRIKHELLTGECELVYARAEKAELLSADRHEWQELALKNQARAEKAEAEVVELKHKLEESTGNYHFCANERDDNKAALSQLQQDVKPLVEIMEAAVGIVAKPVSANIMTNALETFLLKHPELSQ